MIYLRIACRFFCFLHGFISERSLSIIWYTMRIVWSQITAISVYVPRPELWPANCGRVSFCFCVRIRRAARFICPVQAVKQAVQVMLFRCADAFGFLKAADYKQSIKIIKCRWKFTAGYAILNLNTCSRGGIPRKIKESDRSGLYGCKSNRIADEDSRNQFAHCSHWRNYLR